MFSKAFFFRVVKGCDCVVKFEMNPPPFFFFLSPPSHTHRRTHTQNKGLCKTVQDKGENAGILLFLKYFLPLTLSQTTNFRLFQIGRVSRRQFKIWWKLQEVLQTVIKHCGKRRNCSLRAISPFPTVFSKDLYCRHVKTRACLGKG